MDNLTASNPIAHAVRLYYTGSNTIYEGMPVCYEFDATTNWFGGSVSNGEVTASTTTAEGSQNEGKYIRIQDVDADNSGSFAGVVKKGGWVGKSGPRLVDVYVPNGAVVPVRSGVNSTVGITPLCITNGVQDFDTIGRPVAIAMETVDRSSTSGLCLAELCPNKFLYQTGDNQALSIDDQSATTSIIMNRIQLTQAQTAGSFVPLYVHHTHTGNTSTTCHNYNILSYVNLNGTYDQAGYNRNILAQMNLSGTLNSGGAHFYPVYAQLTGTPTATEVGHIAAVGIDCNLGANPTTGNYTGILIANNGANQTQVDSAITIYGNYGINTLFDFESCDGLAGNFISNLGTGANKVITSGATGTTYKVKVNYGGNDAYLVLYSDPTEAAN